jgi:hypothetical protein
VVESGRRRALLLERIDGDAPDASPLAPYLSGAGFSPGQQGFLKRAPLEVTGLRLRAPAGMPRGPLGPDVEPQPQDADLDEDEA